MKTFRILISTLSIAIFVSANLFATNIGDEDKKTMAEKARATYNELRSDINYFVQNPQLKQHNILQEDVMISFKVNEQNQIELINVDSKTPYLKNFVINRLERQAVRTENTIKGKTYNVKVSFISK